MAKSPPAFQFYVQDFLGGVLHLDAEAIGCYLLLLCYQWLHGKVPNNVQTMAMICKKTAPDFEPVLDKIRDKFVDMGDGWLINERLEVVRDRQLMISEKRRESGARGGKANAKQADKQKRTKGRLKLEGRSLKVSEKEMDAAFEIWWGTVTRKEGKGGARKAFGKAVEKIFDRGDDDPIGFLMGRMSAFALSDKANGAYCPLPSTWLNDERYDDDPATWNRQRGQPNGQRAPSNSERILELLNQ